MSYQKQDKQIITDEIGYWEEGRDKVLRMTAKETNIVDTNFMKYLVDVVFPNKFPVEEDESKQQTQACFRYNDQEFHVNKLPPKYGNLVKIGRGPNKYAKPTDPVVTIPANFYKQDDGKKQTTFEGGYKSGGGFKKGGSNWTPKPQIIQNAYWEGQYLTLEKANELAKEGGKYVIAAGVSQGFDEASGQPTFFVGIPAKQ